MRGEWNTSVNTKNVKAMKLHLLAEAISHKLSIEIIAETRGNDCRTIQFRVAGEDRDVLHFKKDLTETNLGVVEGVG